VSELNKIIAVMVENRSVTGKFFNERRGKPLPDEHGLNQRQLFQFLGETRLD
jgi:hypothetical protein